VAPRIVVIGGSVAGLSAALFLSRRGHPVTVLEKDPAPMPTSAAEAGEWRRSATPQAAHSHAFLAGAWRLLRDELPEVLAELEAADVRLTRLRPPDTAEEGVPVEAEDLEDLVVINARRSTFEWALRRAVTADPAIDLRTGVGATDLVLDRSVVAGVATTGGVVAADLVVDAAGKRSPVRSWAAPDAAPDRDVACGISYLTRFYQLRDGDPGPLNRGFTHGASFDRYSCLVFPGDAGSFSVTFGILPEDRALRALLDGESFGAAAAAIPANAPWVDPEVATPTSEVALMASLHNLLRRRPDDAPTGLHTIGDALSITNPAHTRGTTLALLTARALAGAVANHPHEPLEQAALLDRHTDRHLAAWVEDSVGQDADRLRRWRPDTAPEEPLWRYTLSNGQAYLAAQCDAQAWLAFTRLQNALDRPCEVLEDIQLVLTHRQVEVSGWRPSGSEAPDHDELVAIAERCRAAVA
jgi:2-polyprenyl-6-methoxyphenol hydroxylase-like FAD-dependent oxidoreductase